MRIFIILFCFSVLICFESKASSDEENPSGETTEQRQTRIFQTPMRELSFKDHQDTLDLFYNSKNDLQARQEDGFFDALVQLYAFASVDFIMYLVRELKRPDIYLFCARYYDVSPLEEEGVPRDEIFHDQLRKWANWGPTGLSPIPQKIQGPKNIGLARHFYELYTTATQDHDARRRVLELTLDLSKKAVGYEELYQNFGHSKDKERAYYALEQSGWDLINNDNSGERFARAFSKILAFSRTLTHWDYLLMLFKKKKYSFIRLDANYYEEMTNEILSFNERLQREILNILNSPSHLKVKPGRETKIEDEYYRDLSDRLKEKLDSRQED